MDNQDKKEFATLITSMSELYGKEASTDLMKLYFEILIDYSIEDVKQGFNKHVLDPKQGTFFPRPADVVRHISSNQPSLEAKGEMAWAIINKKISSLGSYVNLELGDRQALAAVKALGGWKYVCSKTTEQLVWVKKEFISIYENYENTAMELLPQSLPGRLDLEAHKSIDSQILKRLI